MKSTVFKSYALWPHERERRLGRYQRDTAQRLGLEKCLRQPPRARGFKKDHFTYFKDTEEAKESILRVHL